MKQIRLIIFVVVAVLCAACGGSSSNANKGGLVAGASGDMQTHLSSPVHSIQQAVPALMVIPADQVLQRGGYISQISVNGETVTERKYNDYLLNDNNSKLIISSIQDEFIKMNFPLSDFEQTLKQLRNDSARDLADGISKDAKTELLSVAQPDIILEVDYYLEHSLVSHDYSNSGTVSYTLRAIDAYSNKVIAAISVDQLKGASPATCIAKSLDDKMKKLTNDIQNYFSNILTMGREITIRVNVAEGANINLSNESIEGDTYADWIIDYVKTNTVKGAYKMQRNSDKELYFVNARIPLIKPDGTQYGVYDWSRDLSKNLRKNLGVKCANRAQGLGEVVLTIKEL